MRGEQPARRPSLDGVVPIANEALADLGKQRDRVTLEQE
jgi:hypothetical protein